MVAWRSLLCVAFCACYLASHLTNKIRDVQKTVYLGLHTVTNFTLWGEKDPCKARKVGFCLRFGAAGVQQKEATGSGRREATMPLSSGVGGLAWWQALVGGLLLHVSWRRGWVEIDSSSRSDVLTWLPASMLFVGIIYAGSRALSRLEVHSFALQCQSALMFLLWSWLTVDGAICSSKPDEPLPPCAEMLKLRQPFYLFLHSTLFLLAAAGCLPFNDPQFDPEGYFWAVIHLFCVGAYRIVRKAQNLSVLSDTEQQYMNYIFSVAFLALASHPTGDLANVPDFPFLYFYRFHGSCCASGVLGFLLMLSTVKLQSVMAPGQCAAWIFLAQPPARRAWRGLAGFLRAEELLMTKKGDSQVDTRMESTQALALSSLLEHQKTSRTEGLSPAHALPKLCAKELLQENFLGCPGCLRGTARIASCPWDSWLCCAQFCRNERCRISAAWLHTPASPWRPWYTKRPHLPALHFSPKVKMFSGSLAPSSLHPALPQGIKLC
ncbi:transmembrane protein 241 [Octodon degus]|uniref:Transmembrane protein 241 n=1 Tax=Octodon degus TaxID=10160 RepID=A0A6P6EVL2_OCTDE|nr:transmembrane protein 241 [Octodon degus]